MTTASGPTLEVQSNTCFLLRVRVKVNSDLIIQTIHIFFHLRTLCAKLIMQVLLGYCGNECCDKSLIVTIFFSGPALKVLVNMQVRSMGPISETDMVSGVGVEAKFKICQNGAIFSALAVPNKRFPLTPGKQEWQEGTSNFLSCTSRAFCLWWLEDTVG